MQIRWWDRLGVKLATAIALATVLAMGVSLVLLLRTQRQHLTANALGSAAGMSETILGSIQNDMLEDERTKAYRIMGEIGRQSRITRLRLFDASGTIRFSKDSGEIGHRPDMQADACFPCHGKPRTASSLTLDERTQVSTINGHQILSAITPIYNDTTCSSAGCHEHPSSQRVIGVLELGLSLDDVERDTQSLGRVTSALIVAASVVVGLLTLVLTRRLVVRPVAQLVEATKRVGSGDLDQPAPITGRDEIAALGTSFNRMSAALAVAQAERDQVLQHLEQQVEERTQALAQAQKQLVQTEKLSSLGRLSASIAHEINNPLAGILTVAKLLLRTFQSGAMDEKAQAGAIRHLTLVQRETERCTAIVRNLLGFARERALTVTDADLTAAIDEALFLINNQTSLQGITVSRQLGTLPLVRADFGQLRQAFANIMINACDAMPQGGTLTVSTRHLPAPDEVVVVTIGDTGVGIPREQLSKVLDPFFTTKEKGTGLGLSVVYGIIEHHGGTMTLDSTVGVGTTVTMRVPVRSIRA
jgi:two-component system NtrC family sensor kinase